MNMIVEIIQSKMKPKEIQSALVEGLMSGTIPLDVFMFYFQSAKDKDKGTCADVLKHVSAENPALLEPYFELLLQYINYPHPRVKWGVPETIGNMAQSFPDLTEKAIPYLLRNATMEEDNSTVIRWCAAYGLTEIAKYNHQCREKILPVLNELLEEENNNGVKKIYIKAIKAIQREK